MDIDIARASWKEHGPAMLEIRFAVFVDEQGVPPELEQDEHDSGAFHLLASLANGEAVATARLLPDGHIGRMAVLAPYRGQGIGSRMLRTLIEEAEARGIARVFLHAQVQAIAFYERLGFTADGDVFDDAGIPHRCMAMTIQQNRD